MGFAKVNGRPVMLFSMDFTVMSGSLGDQAAWKLADLTVMKVSKPDDEVLEFNGLRVFVDATSRPYLNGTTVDYVDSLQGSGFKISNPNSSGSCGCGESFSV